MLDRFRQWWFSRPQRTKQRVQESIPVHPLYTKVHELMLHGNPPVSDAGRRSRAYRGIILTPDGEGLPAPKVDPEDGELVNEFMLDLLTHSTPG